MNNKIINKSNFKNICRFATLIKIVKMGKMKRLMHAVKVFSLIKMGTKGTDE